MPSILNENGYAIQSTDAILADLLDGYSYTDASGAVVTLKGFKEIYGADTNFDSDTQDGQWLNSIVQIIRDTQERSLQVYNSRDPDNAVGTQQDSLFAINNIQRQVGTKTQTLIDVVVDRALTLKGTEYTIADDAGNEFVLISDAVFASAGIQSLTFEAVNIGNLITTPNTITTTITNILGVVSVNNPLDATVIGEDEESDVAFRLRRTLSVANTSVRYVEGLIGTLRNITNVEAAIVLENTASGQDSNGIPAHSIWVIVSGGLDDEIGQAIYAKIGGNGMKGTQSVNIATSQGSTFIAKFDRPEPQDLYIQFNIRDVVGIDEVGLKSYIASNLFFDIAQSAYSSDVISVIIDGLAAQSSSGKPVDLLLSTDDVNYTEFLTTLTPQKRFNPDINNISINVL